MSIKVLFMDIDGVVCNDNVGREDWDPVCVLMLKKAILETGVKVVMSSTWRIVAPELMMERLKDFRMETLLHEDYQTKDLIGPFQKYNRSDEIKEWLSRHPEVEKYVIVDDDKSLFDKYHLDEMVLTHEGKGFNYRDYKKVIEKLVD